MGHDIRMVSFDTAVSKEEIKSQIYTCIRHSGDGYGTSSIKFRDNIICNSYKEARKFIEDYDTEWYGGLAVKYYDIDEAKKTKKIETLLERREKEDKILEERMKRALPSNKSGEFITCSHCHSKMNKQYIHSYKCPCCGTDLRTKTSLDLIQKSKEKIAEINKKIEEEKIKGINSKTPIKWLVKFEYHC